MPPKRDQIFISYSHKDKEWLDKLQTMLRPLERDGRLTVWADSVIKHGDKWQSKIEEALASARAAVLLVSDNFLASEFIAKHELPPLLAAAESQGVKIIWVAVSYCLYEKTDIRHYHSANDPISPLDSLAPAEQKRVLADICRVIVEALTPKTPKEMAEEQAQHLEQKIGRLNVEIKAATTAFDWDTAVECLEKLLSIDPTNEGVRVRLANAKREQDLATAYAQGEESLKSDELHLALIQFRAVSAKQSDYKDVKLRLDEIQTAIGERNRRLRVSVISAIKAFDWESATKSLESLVKLHPSDEKLKLELKDVKQKQEQVTKLFNRGLKHLEQNRNLDAALECLRQVKSIGAPFKELDVLIAQTEAKVHKRDDEIQRLISQAESAIASEDWNKAINQLNAALGLNLSNEVVRSKLEFAARQARLQALYEKGQSYYKQRRWRRAEWKFSEIARRDPAYRDVNVWLARVRRMIAWSTLIYLTSAILGVLGSLASLIAFVLWLRGTLELQIGTATLMGTVASWLLCLFALRFANHHDKESCMGCLSMAIVIFVPLVTILSLVFAPRYRTMSAQGYVANAPELIKRGLYDEAISDLTRSLNINPRDAQARLLRGSAYKEKGAHDLAIGDYNYLIQSDNTQEAYFVGRAEAHLAKGDTKNAFTDFGEAVRRWPNPNTYYARGSAYLRIKDYPLAIHDLTRATKDKPDFAEAFDVLGLALYQQQDYDKALVALDQAVGNNSALDRAYLHRGRVYLAKRDFESAIRDFNSTITMNRPKKSSLSKEDLANAYLERGKAHLYKSPPDYSNAATDLVEATYEAPSNPEAYYYLALVYHLQNDYNTAISILNHAIEIQSDYADAYSLRCTSRIGQKAYGAAIDDCSKAIQYKNGKNGVDYLNRGLAYELSGDKENARLDLKKALEFPDLVEQAKKELEKLNLGK